MAMAPLYLYNAGIREKFGRGENVIAGGCIDNGGNHVKISAYRM